MAQVSWTRSALADLRRIVADLSRRTPSTAEAFGRRLFRAPRRLAKAPRSGAIVPEFDRDDIRELVVRRYRLIYLIRGDACFIAMIVHGSRDLESLFDPGDLGLSP